MINWPVRCNVPLATVNTAGNKWIDWPPGTQQPASLILTLTLSQTDCIYCPLSFIRHVHSSLCTKTGRKHFRKTGQEERNDIFPLNSQGWTCNCISAFSPWRWSHMIERHVWFKQKGLSLQFAGFLESCKKMEGNLSFFSDTLTCCNMDIFGGEYVNERAQLQKTIPTH